MICTPEQLIALTRKKRSDAQQRALIAMGIEHIVRPDGTLVVALARVEGLLGVRAGARSPRAEPDWSSLAPAS